MSLAPCQTVLSEKTRSESFLSISVNVAHTAKRFCVLSQQVSNAIFFSGMSGSVCDMNNP